MKIFKITRVQFMTKDEPDFFLMSFKYVFKSIKFPRQNFLFFKFGRVLVRNSGSLPTVPTWGSFPGELPMLQLSSWKKQRGLVPLLPYELFLHSTGISLFPYTHIAETGYWSLIFGSFIWTLPLLASLCSGWFLFYQRHFLSDMFMGPGRQSWGDLTIIFLTLCDQKNIFFLKSTHNRDIQSSLATTGRCSQEQFTPCYFFLSLSLNVIFLNILQWWHLLPHLNFFFFFFN